MWDKWEEKKMKKFKTVKAWAWVDKNLKLINWGGDFLIGPDVFCTLYEPSSEDICTRIEIRIPLKSKGRGK